MTRSLIAPTPVASAPLLESGPDDRYFDYCLEPYRPRRPWRGKLRSENLLWASLDVAGAIDALRPPLLALQEALGRDMTVWGAKWDGTRLFWEIYVYDPQREEPNARVEAVASVLRPWVRVEAAVPPTVPYAMFSFDLDADAIARGTIPEVNVYLTGEQGHAGRSYAVRSGGAELRNTYRFMDPKREIHEVLPLVKASLFVDYSDPTRLSKVLIPELFACRKVCVAKKRQCDGVYFSGIAVEQLVFFLRRFEYPEPLRELVARQVARLDHLAFDVGIDYEPRDGGTTLAYPKTSFYGTL